MKDPYWRYKLLRFCQKMFVKALLTTIPSCYDQDFNDRLYLDPKCNCPEKEYKRKCHWRCIMKGLAAEGKLSISWLSHQLLRIVSTDYWQLKTSFLSTWLQPFQVLEVFSTTTFGMSTTGNWIVLSINVLFALFHNDMKSVVSISTVPAAIWNFAFHINNECI